MESSSAAAAEVTGEAATRAVYDSYMALSSGKALPLEEEEQLRAQLFANLPHAAWDLPWAISFFNWLGGCALAESELPVLLLPPAALTESSVAAAYGQTLAAQFLDQPLALLQRIAAAGERQYYSDAVCAGANQRALELYDALSALQAEPTLTEDEGALVTSMLAALADEYGEGDAQWAAKAAQAAQEQQEREDYFQALYASSAGAKLLPYESWLPQAEATRLVYDAYVALSSDKPLQPEEYQSYRKQLFSNLPQALWNMAPYAGVDQAWGLDFFFWLKDLSLDEESELPGLLLPYGSTDRAFSESYSYALANQFIAHPSALLRLIAARPDGQQYATLVSYGAYPRERELFGLLTRLQSAGGLNAREQALLTSILSNMTDFYGQGDPEWAYK